MSRFLKLDLDPLTDTVTLKLKAGVPRWVGSEFADAFVLIEQLDQGVGQIGGSLDTIRELKLTLPHLIFESTLWGADLVVRDDVPEGCLRLYPEEHNR